TTRFVPALERRRRPLSAAEPHGTTSQFSMRTIRAAPKAGKKVPTSRHRCVLEDREPHGVSRVPMEAHTHRTSAVERRTGGPPASESPPKNPLTQSEEERMR